MERQPAAELAGKVVITDAAEMLKHAIETLRSAGADCEVLPDGLLPEEVVERCRGAAALITAYVPFRKSTLERLQGVGLIVRCGVGVDLIDLDAAGEQGIWVANVPDYAVDEVADHAMMLLLAAARQLTDYQRRLAGWGASHQLPVRRLRGRRLGIIGLGRIGSQVALRANAFGMDVVAYTPHLTQERARHRGATAVSLDQLLQTSDAISLHAPLTDQTRHLLDAAAFVKMRPGVIIVNTARGGLIDIEALQTAIDRGIVAAAALDVLEGEPFPDRSLPMFRAPNVIITPHVAWYSEDAVRDLGVLAAEEALRFLRGEPLRAVLNPQVRPARAGH